MARNHTECRAMIDACATAGVPLFVAYYRRALPRFLKIKELIDTGAIGEARFVAITLHQPLSREELDPATLPWRVDPAIAGGGRFVDLASHQLDFLDFALGPVADVRGFASNQAGYYQAEDIVSGAFTFASGAHGVGTWCFTTYGREDRTEIVGSEGKISYATFDETPVVLATRMGTTEFTIANPPHIQQPMIQLVVNALNDVGTSPSTGETGARTSWVMDRMLDDRSL
jgi:predicted dehydrogenase